MEAVFLKLVNMSITASWLVLAIVFIRLIFRKMPKWILCLLWGLVGLRLVWPFSLESNLSLIPSSQTLPQDIIYSAHPQIQSGIAVIDRTVNPVLASSLTPVSQAVSVNPTQVWSFIFSQVWFLGMAGMLLYALASFLLLKYRVRTAVPVQNGIRQSEAVVSPFVLGFLKPVIYLPFDVDSADIPYVIAHECTHIQRKDHWWKPIGFLLLSIYWFNPVLWVSYILLCRDIEAACDERVIKDMDKDAVRKYSTALLNCSVHRRSIAVCPLAFGETSVKSRIQWIMHYRKPAFWVVLIAVIISIVVAVCFLTDPDPDAEHSVIIIENSGTSNSNTVTWFNKLEPTSEELQYGQKIPVNGLENTFLYYNLDAGTLWVKTPTVSKTLFSGFMVWNLFLSDLNGDGIQEVCATIRPEYMDQIYILDIANDQTYELADSEEYFYRLTTRENTLFLVQYNMNWNVVGYGHPVLLDGSIVMEPLKEDYLHLTEMVRCVDVNNRKMVCVSNQEDVEKILSILKTIRDKQVPVSLEEWEEVYKSDYWNANIVEINYELGQETLHFSSDYSIYWNANENQAYRLNDPEALKTFVEETTNGVIKRTTTGEPFATMDTPWDWCQKLTDNVVVTARLDATYDVSANSVTGTNGIMSQKTLDQFIQIINAIPKAAFITYESQTKQSFRDFVSGLSVIGSGISILDGVNSLAAGFVYSNGEVNMVLTTETDQFDRGNFFYMTSYRLYKVDDPQLETFMKELIKSTPVITYTVGAEYNWQQPLTFTADNFKLELNLIEGWISEYVTLPESSGIRIRPEEEQEGWLYFSYWPQDYHPLETDRYVSEGMAYGFQSYTSYPSSVKTPTSFSTYHVVWSYRRYDMEAGDYVVINDGADTWFLKYEDQITYMDTLAKVQITS